MWRFQTITFSYYKICWHFRQKNLEAPNFYYLHQLLPSNKGIIIVAIIILKTFKYRFLPVFNRFWYILHTLHLQIVKRKKNVILPLLE